MALRSIRTPGIKDVAQLAGVAPSTVSKALNNVGQLKEETRERVRRAAEQLGFTPDSRGRALASGRSFTVGLITTDSSGRFSIPIMLGAEDALSAGEMALVLCDTRDDPLREQHYLKSLVSRRVDGIIVTGRRTDPRPPLAGVHDGVPVVYALSPSTDPHDISVVSDEAQGCRLAVEHLLSTGRTRVAHITGPAHHAAAANRAEFTEQVLAESGLELSTGRSHFGDWSEAWGRRAADAVLRLAPDTDAFFCGNDQIGRGVTDALRERGVEVPGEVAVIGYDNWDIMTLAARPPLTTIDSQLIEIGRVAALRLLEAIDDNVSPGVHRVPCRLVVRDSA
jgi:DNA-binding LacI/PurR family transcriptional regulator